MDLYFRIKENGATVFRIVTKARQRRMHLQPVAEANVRNGEIKPRKNEELSDADRAAIEDWIGARQATLSLKEGETIRNMVEQINLAANWYSGKPDPAAADGAADDLLMAMHDLRAAIVRYKSKAAGG